MKTHWQNQLKRLTLVYFIDLSRIQHVQKIGAIILAQCPYKVINNLRNINSAIQSNEIIFILRK